MHRLLLLLCCRLLCYYLAVQCRLSCGTTTLCSLVPFPSLLVAPLYLPPLLCDCVFLHRHELHDFIQARQLWQALGCKCTWCAKMRLHMFYKQSVLFTVFSGSRPQWQGHEAAGYLARTLKRTHAVANPPFGKLLTRQQKVQQPNVLHVLVQCCFVKLGLSFIVGMQGVNCGNMHGS